MTGDAMSKPATHHWTYQDYLELPDDGTRCEIIEGERLMTPAPWLRHQSASIRLASALLLFVEKHDLGRVLAAPFDVIVANHESGEVRSVVVLPGFSAKLADVFKT